MNLLIHRSIQLVVAGAATAAGASAQTLISDNFELDSSADYTVVDDGTPDGTQTFAFDYVAAGVPAAPRSSAGDRSGLKLTANDTIGTPDAATVFHNTLVAEPHYKLTVDVWMNFAGTAGTTEHAHVGVAGDGTTWNQLFSPIAGSGAFIAFTGDGGSGSDYRWFRDCANTPPGGTGCTTLPNDHPSYLGHGSNNSGAFFQALFPSPPSTIAGSPGNIWTTLEIEVNNITGVISFSFDGTLTFRGNFFGPFFGQVSLGMADVFNSVSAATNYTLYDNLVVEVVECGDYVDAFEENDDCASAMPITLGPTNYLSANDTDLDFYSLTLQDGETLNVNMLFTDADGDLDIYLTEASNPNCGGTAAGDYLVRGFSASDDEFITWSNTTGGPVDYVLWVDFFGTGCNTYDLFLTVSETGTLGGTICRAEPNSAGPGANLSATGSDVASDNNVTLGVDGLPMNSMGYFVNSMETNFVANPGGSLGNLCIASFTVGRHDQNVLDSGAGDSVSLVLDLASLPGPLGTVAAVGGEAWYWQYWYRDMAPTGAGSNFSSAICIEFQ